MSFLAIWETEFSFSIWMFFLDEAFCFGISAELIHVFPKFRSNLFVKLKSQVTTGSQVLNWMIREASEQVSPGVILTAVTFTVLSRAFAQHRTSLFGVNPNCVGNWSWQKDWQTWRSGIRDADVRVLFLFCFLLIFSSSLFNLREMLGFCQESAWNHI